MLPLMVATRVRGHISFVILVIRFIPNFMMFVPILRRVEAFRDLLTKRITQISRRWAMIGATDEVTEADVLPKGARHVEAYAHARDRGVLHPGALAPDLEHVGGGSPERLSPLALLPLGHGELCVRQSRVLFSVL